MAETNLFVFGDSLSDTGNSFELTGIPPFPYFQGRFSNGIVAVEYLETLLEGLSEESSYTLNPENNFAFGGATTGQGNANEDDLGVDLPGLQDQIDSFTTAVGSGGADSTGLYLVWAGPNDFLDTLGGSTLADPAELLRQAAVNLIGAVKTLEGLGAEEIVLPNALNLGRLPAAQDFRAEATAIAKAFNAAIALEVGNLDFAVTQVDLFATGEAIAADPASFGFSNTTDPLLPLQFSANPPLNPEEFFFWDQFHPTTQGHEVLATTIFQTITGEIEQPSFTDIPGTAQADTLKGTAANDNLDGFGKKDLLQGAAGDDILEGWGGQDRLVGGQGKDILQGSSGDDVISGGDGDDIAFGGSGNDQISGDANNDVLVGDAGDDSIQGGDGNDYLLGGANLDGLSGGAGQDTLNGGLAEDILVGGAGRDRLEGGAGDDQLTGGSGVDQFVYRPESGVDRILDFIEGTEQIDLTSFGFEDFEDFTSSATLSGNTIDFGEGNVLRLRQVDVSALSESDLILS